MERKTIGPVEIEASYLVAREWMSDKMSRSAATDKLEKEHGLNRVSAGDLLQVLKSILNGDRFTRSISASAAEFYVKRIALDDGWSAAHKAIYAIEKHVAYYESVQPSKMRKMRTTLSQLRSDFKYVEKNDEPSAFEKEVLLYSKMTADQRDKSLPKLGHKPASTFVRIAVFIRSAAVVAEVLKRANGTCETCKRPAPFIKATNGEPYLEVHHRIQLAKNGDDTVENAIAVCPNCHRFHHYG